MALLESLKQYRRLAPIKSLQSQVLEDTYTPTRFLGRGASASVWEAVASTSSNRIALKIFDQGSKDRKQAARELRVLSRVHHPNIVKAFEIIEGGQFAQLVCEVVDGESLRSFTHRQEGHKLSPKIARLFYQQVVDGVQFCHERLVVHRDLKLENLLLNKEAETVKIIDFGFATQVGSKETKLKAFCGTPSYMAPEIVRGEGYSGFAVDVWALGVVIFALLCGSLPFAARTEMQLYAKIRRAIVTIPDALGELPRRLLRGILRNDAVTRPAASAVARHPWVTGEGDSRPFVDGSMDASTSFVRDLTAALTPRFAPEARRRLSPEEGTCAASHPAPSAVRPQIGPIGLARNQTLGGS
jgi:MAP/microtubule affinity-regulating kinase